MGKHCTFFLLLVGCAGTVAAATHTGTIDFTSDFADVELKLAQPSMVITTRSGHRADLRRVETCTGNPVRWRSVRRFVLPSNETCVRYRVRLRSVQGRLTAVVPEDVVVVSPARFMWLPRLSKEEKLDLSVTSKRSLSLPWQNLAAGRWRVRGSPNSNESVAVLGGVSFPVAGLRQPVVLVTSNATSAQQSKARRWLESNLDVLDVNPYAQIVLFLTPSQPGRSPVPYGDVIRDQGETVRFFVDLQRGYDELSYDWTAAHELAHLQLPYVNQRWISEGFASYYQNVLQARRGAYSEADAWSRLLDKFQQAEQSSGGMSPSETGRYPFYQARLMIYWSGAALALAADVALRERGSSLDRVLDALRQCCLPEQRSYTARELFQRLDALHGEPVIAPIFEQYAQNPGMPEFESIAHRLGIEYRNGSLTLDDDAPLAVIRKEIMSPAL